jgi:ligand-binding SRPBCC domain-containing protein
LPVIKIHTIIHAPILEVFNLSRDIGFHEKSAAHTSEKAIDGITSGLINLNEKVTWRAKHFGINQTFTSRISELNCPDYFVDEMEKGIFKSFHHQHIFKEKSGITTMTDILDYTSPLGILGRIVDFLFLKKYLSNFLQVRNTAIKN